LIGGDKLRTFITFDFDLKTKQQIANIQRIIKDNSNKGRFKYYNNFHLTLQFLGETDLSTVNEIYDQLLKAAKSFSKVKVFLQGIDAFVSGNNIRTIYLKVHGELEKIKNIAEKVFLITNKFGFKKDNKFIPHVTIAQDVDLNISFDELKEKVKGIKIDNIVFDKIIIMKSEEIEGKRIYTPLKILYLK